MKKIYPLVLLTLIFCQGCYRDLVHSAMKTHYEKGNVRTVAVIPFENLTANIRAGQDMSLFCYSEMFELVYRWGMGSPEVCSFSLMDETQVRAVFEEQKWLDKNPHTIGLKKIAETLKAQVLLFGTVNEYHYKRGLGEDPVAGLHLRLYDLETDTIIWTGSHSQAGRFSWFREDSLTRLAREVCRMIIHSMDYDLKRQLQP